LLAALPERPAPLDDEDNNKMPNLTADTAANIDDNHIKNSNANSNDANNNNNNNNGNESADEDTIAPITRIGLRPVEKTVAVVVDNANTCKRRHVASLDLNNESDTAAPTSRAKHARVVPNTRPAGKVS
jgi:hypothetical protein